MGPFSGTGSDITANIVLNGELSFSSGLDRIQKNSINVVNTIDKKLIPSLGGFSKVANESTSNVSYLQSNMLGLQGTANRAGGQLNNLSAGVQKLSDNSDSLKDSLFKNSDVLNNVADSMEDFTTAGNDATSVAINYQQSMVKYPKTFEDFRKVLKNVDKGFNETITWSTQMKMNFSALWKGMGLGISAGGGLGGVLNSLADGALPKLAGKLALTGSKYAIFYNLAKEYRDLGKNTKETILETAEAEVKRSESIVDVINKYSELIPLQKGSTADQTEYKQKIAILREELEKYGLSLEENTENSTDVLKTYTAQKAADFQRQIDYLESVKEKFSEAANMSDAENMMLSLKTGGFNTKAYAQEIVSALDICIAEFNETKRTVESYTQSVDSAVQSTTTTMSEHGTTVQEAASSQSNLSSALDENVKSTEGVGLALGSNLGLYGELMPTLQQEGTLYQQLAGLAGGYGLKLGEANTSLGLFKTGAEEGVGALDAMGLSFQGQTTQLGAFPSAAQSAESAVSSLAGEVGGVGSALENASPSFGTFAAATQEGVGAAGALGQAVSLNASQLGALPSAAQSAESAASSLAGEVGGVGLALENTSPMFGTFAAATQEGVGAAGALGQAVSLNASQLGALPSAAQSAESAASSLAGGIGGVGLALENTSPLFGTFAAANEAGAGAVGAMEQAVGVQSTQLGTLPSLLQSTGSEYSNLSLGVSAYGEKTAEVASVVEQQVEGNENLVDSGKKANKAVKEQAEKSGKLTKATKDVQVGYQGMIAVLQMLMKMMGMGCNITIEQKGTIDNLADAAETAEGEINELNQAAAENTEAMSEAGKGTKEAAEGLIDAAGAADGATEKTGLLQQGLGLLKANWQGAAGMAAGFMDKALGTGSVCSQLTGTLINMASQGFNPLSVATGVASLAMGLFGKKKERVKVSMEDFMKHLGEFGEELNETGERVKSLSEKFNSNILGDYEKKMEAANDDIDLELAGYINEVYDLEAVACVLRIKKEDEDIEIDESFISLEEYPFLLDSQPRKILRNHHTVG